MLILAQILATTNGITTICYFGTFHYQRYFVLYFNTWLIFWKCLWYCLFWWHGRIFYCLWWKVLTIMVQIVFMFCCRQGIMPLHGIQENLWILLQYVFLILTDLNFMRFLLFVFGIIISSSQFLKFVQYSVKMYFSNILFRVHFIV